MFSKVMWNPATEQMEELFWGERLGFWLLLRFAHCPLGRPMSSAVRRNDKGERVRSVNLQ